MGAFTIFSGLSLLWRSDTLVDGDKMDIGLVKFCASYAQTFSLGQLEGKTREKLDKLRFIWKTFINMEMIVCAYTDPLFQIVFYIIYCMLFILILFTYTFGLYLFVCDTDV